MEQNPYALIRKLEADLERVKRVVAAGVSGGGGGASALDDLSDVTITAAATGDVIRFNGTAWVDAVLAQSDITNLVSDLAAKAPLASPTFTGTPSLPTGTTGVTQTAGDSTTKLATTAFVTGGISTSSSADRARANHTGTQTASTISDFDTQVRTSKIHQLALPTAATPMNGQILTGLGAGSGDGHSLRYEQLFTSGSISLLGGLTLPDAATFKVGTGATRFETYFDGSYWLSSSTRTAMGAGSLSFGSSSVYDWTLSRTGADAAAVGAGDTLDVSAGTLKAATVAISDNSTKVATTAAVTTALGSYLTTSSAASTYVPLSGAATITGGKLFEAGASTGAALKAGVTGDANQRLVINGNGDLVWTDPTTGSTVARITRSGSTLQLPAGNLDLYSTGTGTVTVPTKSAGDNSNNAASTAYVDAASTADRSRANHTGTQTASTISDFDTQVRTSKIHQLALPTAATPMNGQKFTGLGAGSAAGDSLRYEQLFTTGAVTLLGGLKTTGITVEAASASQPGIGVGLTGGAQSRAILGLDASNNAQIRFGNGAGATDWSLTRTAADVASLGSGDTLDTTAGTLTAATQTAGDNSTKVATTAFVTGAAAAGIPGTIGDAKGDLIGFSADNTAVRIAAAASNGSVLTSDTSQTGGVKWAGPAAVSLYNPDFGGAATLTAATERLLDWNTEEYDYGGFHAAGSSDIVIPTGYAGVYHFDVELYLSPISSSHIAYVRVAVYNGSGTNLYSMYRVDQNPGSSTLATSPAFGKDIYLADGYKIQVSAYSSLAGTMDVTQGRTTFSMHRVAAV